MGAISWPTIISASNRARCLEKAQNLKVFRGLKKPAKEAAVLVPLCLPESGEPCLLYTLRSSSLRSHSGQVSFPGGNKDPEDQNLQATAFRETQEEIGLTSAKITPWFFFPPTPSKNAEQNVYPLLAHINQQPFNLNQLTINQHEVQEVFLEKLSTLCDFNRFECQSYTVGVTEIVLPAFLGEKHRIWGLTAIMTYQVLSCLVPDGFQLQVEKLERAKKLSAHL